MRERIEFEVDGWKYATTQYGATKSTKIWALLINKVGPSLGGVVSAVNDNGGSILDGRLDMAKLGDSLTTLTQAFSPDEWLDFVKQVLSDTSAGTSKGEYPTRIIPEIFEDHFAGSSQMRMLKVVWKVLEVNYNDFIGGLSGKFSGIMMGLQSNSLQTSTGKSGDSSSRVQRLSKK